MHALTLIQVVAFLAAFAAQGSRIFVATRPFWAKLPGWLQVALPPVIPAFAALAQGLAGVTSWTDLTVVLIGCAALVLPGLPSNRSAAPLQAGKKPRRDPSPQDVAVANVVARNASYRPAPLDPDEETPDRFFPPSVPPAAALLLCCCLALHQSACFHGSFWPKVERCAPSPASLVSQVADILLAGGDYESALRRKALDAGAAAVECAVQVAVDSLRSNLGASPENGPAVARGDDFLMRVSAQK